MTVYTIPPQYTEYDKRNRDRLYQELVELEREFNRRSEPIRQALQAIEARYPPRYIVSDVEPSQALIEKVRSM